MSYKRLIVLLASAMLVLSISIDARAQAGTPVPSPVPTPEVTQTITPVSVMADIVPVDKAIDGLSLVIYVIIAFSAGGLAGAAGAGVLAARLLGNKDALDAMERIAISTIPVSALATIHSIAVSLETSARLAAVVTDGEPNVADPPVVSIGTDGTITVAGVPLSPPGEAKL